MGGPRGKAKTSGHRDAPESMDRAPEGMNVLVRALRAVHEEE